MNKELTPQKERFLREVEQQLLRRDLDARPLEDGLIHIKWKELMQGNTAESHQQEQEAKMEGMAW